MKVNLVTTVFEVPLEPEARVQMLRDLQSVSLRRVRVQGVRAMCLAFRCMGGQHLHRLCFVPGINQQDARGVSWLWGHEGGTSIDTLSLAPAYRYVGEGCRIVAEVRHGRLRILSYERVPDGRARPA